ncbi:hypothetical protein G6M26_23325 [Agrobacterium tumefaciens]|nr:hypothetical protein [Agrobacterium tumefaciens]NTE21475.1 hypothetical protein [Agrobacterium tumefaciens]
MTREELSKLINEFISTHGSVSNLWKCSIFTSQQFQAIIEFGCKYTCESNLDATLIKEELTKIGVKYVGNSLVAVSEIHKYITVFKGRILINSLILN